MTARKASRRKSSASPSRERKRSPKSSKPRKRARCVFFFGNGRAEGSAALRDLLGGKGANLAEMSRLGIPVPPGFTISTDVCAQYLSGGKPPPGLKSEVQAALVRLERSVAARFGDSERPLLVSVRSGARVSMPGMMDTVLNLGLNDVTVKGLAKRAGERFAYDCYRRFVQMYGDVVLGTRMERFEGRLSALKRQRGVELDTELSAEDLKTLVRDYLDIVGEETGAAFPQNPGEQLWGAVGAVFRSWGNDRARIYRRLNDVDEAWGTAVNIQAMVFGNMGDDCATGVAFTRDPSTGDKHLYGEYLLNAQGEDVVAGIRTPLPINAASRGPRSAEAPTFEEEMPGAYRELVRIYKKLEKHYRDMQDIEFTVQSGVLWMLQTRAGKRTPAAAVKIAVGMAKERLISREEAILRVDPSSFEALLHPMLDPAAERTPVARGLPASPGAAQGKVVFDADVAVARAKAGEKVILVRIETSPNDIHGMAAAEGILTARGGMTSHAAVVARGMGKCCVAGCSALEIDHSSGELTLAGRRIREGDPITLDGGSGEVMLGSVPTVIPELGGDFVELMRWADRRRTLKVRTNADTPQEAEVARQFGAEGIGLCRTEHMFFQPSRIHEMQRMILAADSGERERALLRLLPMQRDDFVGIFRAMDGLPVTIRLLDPPLHEFVPRDDDEIRALAETLESDVAEVRAKLDKLAEYNPMLGHRGCRLGITYPEIYRMQVRAITEAACEAEQAGVDVKPEIMIPLVAHEGELARLRALAEETIREVRNERPEAGVQPSIGTMIEVPRAALTADVIALHADFFSFGTNDLTQMTYALSRDDAGKFLPDYIEGGILKTNPFVSIDEAGIGQLIQLGVERGRRTRRSLTFGVCGEHGGDPQSIKFFHRCGLDYVSCSPYRVPVARLAAAQAAIEAASGR